MKSGGKGMGLISSKIRNKFQKLSQRKIIPISESAEARRISSEISRTVKTHDQLRGYDPVHATYILAQNLASVFAEQLSALPEMKEYYDAVAHAEDIYMPQGPPISPLTGSYFTLWAFFDLSLGKDRETVGTCFIELADILKVHPEQQRVLQLLQASRMGIFEHCGTKRKLIELKEILTGKTHFCVCPAGYPGKRGELWYARILPSPIERLDYSVVMTTPYVLIGHAKSEWINFFQRHAVSETDPELETTLHQFMKYGESRYFWNEYIFEAYFNHRHDVIFLEGIPDLKETLPHADSDL